METEWHAPLAYLVIRVTQSYGYLKALGQIPVELSEHRVALHVSRVHAAIEVQRVDRSRVDGGDAEKRQ